VAAAGAAPRSQPVNGRPAPAPYNGAISNRLDEIEVLSTAHGRLACFRDDHTTEHLRRFGRHQGSDLHIALDLARPGDVVVDVGAHVGTFTVPLSRRVGPRGTVTSFEGAPSTFGLLERNLSTNGCDNVEPIHAVVSSQPGRRYRLADQPHGAGATYFEPSGSLAGIESLRLDDWWRSSGRSVGFLKIDVEGHEGEVLRGARAMLEVDRPIVLLEVSRAQLRRYGSGLRDLDRLLHGYHLFINLAERNSASDEYRLARLPRMQALLLGGGNFWHLDVLAVDPGSDRYPVGFVGAGVTLGRLVALGLLPSAGRRVGRAFR
jgi:FkbM family methyltransferase